jgi:succinyl-diaminopimelate desuccinylase
MNTAEKRLMRSIDNMERDIIKLLSDLVKAESVTPPGDTRNIAGILTNKFREFGIEPQIVSVDEDKPNLIAEINPGHRPQLVFNSHIDTVPPGDLRQWEFDPFGATIKDGMMFGRGVADAKASVAAMTMAAGAVAKSGIELTGTMLVNPVSDEEAGGSKGTKFLLDQQYLAPNYVVIGEQTNNQIAIVEKGVVWFTITTFGRTAHGSTPWHGVNAIEKMVNFLTILQEDVGSKLKAMTHPLTPPPSLNIGTIQGGIKINVVPDTCIVNIDRRILPEETPEQAQQQIVAVLNKLQRFDPDFKAEMEIQHAGSPVNTAPTEFIVKVAQEINSALDLNAELIGYKQASDGRFFTEQGIPTIILGPSDPKVGHAPNEHLNLRDVVTTTKIYALIAIRSLT